MGRHMIPCCCICGRCAESYDDSKWKYQDFCPKHDFLITLKLRPAKQSLVEEAEEVLNEIIDSWESLEGGRNYNKRDIERWLIRDMKPVMDKARIFVGREIPS